MEQLDKALENLKAAILSRPPKTQEILIAWLNKWAALLRSEESFPKDRLPRLPFYKRGNIVYADLGFNVGAEFGGVHYAVVIERNNGKKSENLLVVPLTSKTPGKPIYKTDVMLGNVINDQTETVAKPSQVRAISKMRIIKLVVDDNLKRVKLNNEQLQRIDDQLQEIFCLGLTNK